MIIEVKMYSGKCDNCGCTCEHWHYGWTALVDENAVSEMMQEQSWATDETEERHYCPDCHKIGEDGELIINPKTPTDG